MEDIKPKLPSKLPNEPGATPTSIQPDTPLPTNSQLLSSFELLNLVKEQKEQLTKYVAQYNPTIELEVDISNLRQRLEQLEEKFIDVENKKGSIQENIEQCQIIESDYVKEWQNLQNHIKVNYSTSSLKKKLEYKLIELDDKSNEIEIAFSDIQDLDNYVNKYMNLRTEYHLRREKLINWNKQDELYLQK